MSSIKINPVYSPIITSSSRYFVCTGGRGSGKSFSITVELLLMLLERGHVILFTRYTMRSASISIIPEFLEKIELLGLQGVFDVTKDEITCKTTGSKILFRGLKTSSGDQTANLKSLNGVTTWVLDEAEELTDEGTFDDINLSVRKKGIQNRVVLILNPTTKEHFIYKRFFESVGVESGKCQTVGDVTYIHTTYLDNIKHLSKSFLNDIERVKTQNPEKYKHKILGGWLDKLEGVVFTNWKYAKFNPDGLQTSCGLDFGYSVDPDALVEVAIDKARFKIYLKLHIYKRGLSPQDLANMIRTAVGNKLVVCDSAQPRLWNDLKSKGVNIVPVKKGTIESGVTMMQGFELIVDEDSTELGKELNHYVYKDKGSALYVDDYNHGIDAARYNIIHHLDNPNRGKYSIF